MRRRLIADRVDKIVGGVEVVVVGCIMFLITIADCIDIIDAGDGLSGS